MNRRLWCLDVDHAPRGLLRNPSPILPPVLKGLCGNNCVKARRDQTENKTVYHNQVAYTSPALNDIT